MKGLFLPYRDIRGAFYIEWTPGYIYVASFHFSFLSIFQFALDPVGEMICSRVK